MRQEGACYLGGYYFQPSGQKSKKMMPECRRKQEREIVSPKQWPWSCREWSCLNMVLFSKAYRPNKTTPFELFKTFNYTDITKKKKVWELQKSPSAYQRKCFSSLDLRTAFMLHWFEKQLASKCCDRFSLSNLWVLGPYAASLQSYGKPAGPPQDLWSIIYAPKPKLIEQ